MSLTLYYHPLASFCHKVLVALYENGREFDKRIINVGEDADRAVVVDEHLPRLDRVGHA